LLLKKPCITINVENGCAAQGFMETDRDFIQDSQELHLKEMIVFCKSVKVFTVTFDQFNISLLNKNINFVQKNY